MLTNNYIFIDIETVPDKELIEKSICKINNFKNFEEYREHEQQFVKPGKTWFPKIIFHKPVCIGMLYINQYLQFKYIDFCNKNDDKEILNSFWGLFKQCCLPTLVTYAGKSFDMVVLENRGIKYINQFSDDAINGLIDYQNDTDKWEQYRPNYKNRYSKYHIDLIEQFGSPRASLIEACSLYDIEVKNEGHGSKIDEMSNNEIRKYCFEDIIATAMLWTVTHQINMEHQTIKNNTPQELISKLKQYKTKWLENIGNE